MHEPLLALAALPAPTIIQRTTLRPYSLGHELILIRERNAFIFGGDPTRKDLIQAVWICVNTWQENARAHDEFLAPIKARLIARRFRKCNLSQCIQEFRQYLESGSLELPLSDIPRSQKDQAPSRFPGAPLILRLHAFVMTHLRKSEAEAWDYPVGLAKMRWAAHWEQEGGLDIYGPHDESFKRFREDPATQKALEELRNKGKTKCRA